MMSIISIGRAWAIRRIWFGRCRRWRIAFTAFVFAPQEPHGQSEQRQYREYKQPRRILRLFRTSHDHIGRFVGNVHEIDGHFATGVFDLLAIHANDVVGKVHFQNYAQTLIQIGLAASALQRQQRLHIRADQGTLRTVALNHAFNVRHMCEKFDRVEAEIAGFFVQRHADRLIHFVAHFIFQNAFVLAFEIFAVADENFAIKAFHALGQRRILAF